MDANQETVKSVTGRLNVLRKGLVSEGNSVQYYQTLVEKTPEDSEENIGARRMYEEMIHEESLAEIGTLHRDARPGPDLR